MSTTSAVQDYECGYCEETFEPPAVKQSYCSYDCYYQHKGEKALNQIESDHTVCATCHSKIKSIEAPPEGVSVNIPPAEHEQSNGLTENVLIGYQYQTPKTRRYADQQGDGAKAVYYTRWSCECGTVDPNERDDILEQIDLKQTVTNLCERLHRLSSEGAVGGSFNHNRFLEAFEKDDRNWAYATGYGLYGSQVD